VLNSASLLAPHTASAWTTASICCPAISRQPDTDGPPDRRRVGAVSGRTAPLPPLPGAASADLRGGPRRNFQVFSALDFLAEVTQHIPDKGEHLVRYYGWYSHRQRGLRAKSQSAAVSDSDLNVDEITKRVYEVDPLKCPHCGAAMKIVSFIECRQRDVIERILRHCGLWESPLRTLASARGPPGRTAQVPEPRCDLELVLDPEFL
jgi:hypothetical protein